MRVFGADGEIAVRRTPDGLWSGDGVVVGFATEPERLGVRLVATAEVSRVQLRWRGDLGAGSRYLGDHWERGYGDLEWRAETPERPLPWYVLVHHPGPGGDPFFGVTHGYGVRVRPGALCFWTADQSGLSLWADVRAGGRPVRLGGRSLAVADVVARRGEPGESAFAVHRALCRRMCPHPLLPDHPVLGTNDWHVHYGRAGAEVVLRASEQVSGWVSGQERPYSVIDDGWSQGGLGTGPWLGNDRFGDMASLAARMRGTGVRPGIWYRPLTAVPGVPMPGLRGGVMDPSVPEVLDVVAETVRRLVSWGYELVKHDFTTWDVLGRWGFEMRGGVTDGGWGFARADRTTAEVLTELYGTIRQAAGERSVLIGCNTIGHLAAGFVELQRIGDDTSGVSWNRTRRMGVNALAFRAAQHGTFFSADADVAPVTAHLPWRLARQWLELLADSGTPLFVSVSPEVQDPAVIATVADALQRAAASPASPASPADAAGAGSVEPLDWLETRCPRRWRIGGLMRVVDWSDAGGPWPFPD